ncbi:MAG: prepilin-type N-terminal cleavage/methylation domain-containing protein [Moorea sp. SIOASIH]|uniref:hormogonium polysaccharide secretion pseudopilin HpsC n=1 Tax=Moorena sp. SIOASIH TaxID=2607817 RepID=UPI0013B83294|nr:hormogonium polysaccharide secretion pseudopilin HpsC [Moorena sp. SIOASIH]NEO37456.1 prepilin-type N-terminal cleavage/methylation domain-containing protein [Moorena sp. SIOASIH]
MIRLLRTFLAHQLKTNKAKLNHGGFTLIELLVAMIVAVLIIAPLLRFMITIVDTDRKEQAKATSEQEIQAAMDYIARDLEQAVYIYDNSGVERDNAGKPEESGIRNQIPPIAAAPGCNTDNCQPVLVFWKRKYFDRTDTVDGKTIGDFTNENDTFVYALVAYYLITDKNDTWSDIARIGRFEVYDQVTDATSTQPNAVGIPASPGFQSFKLSDTSGSSLKEKLNQWTKGAGNYETQAQILVDYIDVIDEDDPNNKIEPGCPIVFPQEAPNLSQDEIQKKEEALQVPSNLNGGFYACVDAEKRIAQVFLRGNALARLKNKKEDYEYQPNRSSYFPTVTMQIEGRGSLGL